MRKYSLVLALATAAAAGLLSPEAKAAMTLDLRLAGGGKSLTLSSLSQVVTMEVWALVPDTDTTGNSGVVGATMRFTSTEGGTALLGDLSAATRLAPFNSLGSNGAQAAGSGYDANADKEWGGAFPTTSVTGYFFPNSLTANPGNVGTVSGGVMSIQLGTITWTHSGGAFASGQTTSINIVPYVNSSTGKGSYNYYQDGVQFANTLGSANLAADVLVGSAVVLSAPVTTTEGEYTLAASMSNTNVLLGGATTLTSTLNNTGTGTDDSINFTNLNASASAGGSIGGSGTNGGPITQGASSSNTGLTFTGTAYGSVTVTPTVATATNANIPGNASLQGTTTVNVNVGRATAATNGDGTFGANALTGTSTGAGLSSRVVNGTENSNAQVTNMDAGSAVSMNWRLADVTDLAPLFSDVVFIDALGTDQTYDLKIYYADDYNGIENQLFLGRRNNDGTYNAAGGLNVDTNDVVIDGISYGGFVWASGLSGDGTFAVIPEPTSLALLGLGAAGLLARRKKA